jgi:hypothetical protein
MHISFPPNTAAFDFGEDAVTFPVIIDGVHRLCLVKLEYLQSQFGANDTSVIVPMFEKRRHLIEKLVKAKIKAGVAGDIVIE